MSRLLVALLVTAGLAFGGCAAQTRTTYPSSTMGERPMAPITKDQYDKAVKDAEAQYKTDQAACSSRTGNAKDLCIADAKGREKTAKADAEAAYKTTPKAHEDARIARAEADHDVAKLRCNDMSGNAKEVCLKQADADLTKAKADAKVDRVAADTRQDSAKKQAEARHEATEARRDADYELAIEKCNSLTGPVKDACISDAKTYYGK
jgi:hypothetical protein